MSRRVTLALRCRSVRRVTRWHWCAGRVQELGRPGTLLGLLRDPELPESRSLLRAGDSLILFTDGVTEARRRGDRDLYGEDRLRGCVAGLGEASAAGIADAIQRAVMAFSSGEISDDTAVLVLKVPPHEGPAGAVPGIRPSQPASVPENEAAEGRSGR